MEGGWEKIDQSCRSKSMRRVLYALNFIVDACGILARIHVLDFKTVPASITLNIKLISSFGAWGMRLLHDNASARRPAVVQVY